MVSIDNQGHLDLGSDANAINGNGTSSTAAAEHELTIEQLSSELPNVQDGQVPLSELLSRIVQAIYAEMIEFAETMPQMSDAARKRTLADFAVRTKKQITKLYAVMRWARDADIVQKCMNITGFLMNHNRQIEDAVEGLQWSKGMLGPAQLRNHDLLTSLDVLTTGSYRRLPTIIKKQVLPPDPVNSVQIGKTFQALENLMRYRLRVEEPMPYEMTCYQVTNGRVEFTVPNLFIVSLSLRGGLKFDGWFFLHVEFTFGISQDVHTLQEFPRRPSGLLKQFVEEEANAQLAFYIPKTSLPDFTAMHFNSETPKLAQGVIDAPLIRLFNFLQVMSLSYQLEVLYFQASRLRSLGWAEFLYLEMAPDRKSFKATYWVRKNSRQQSVVKQPSLPPCGGSVVISLVPHDHRGEPSFAANDFSERVLAGLDKESKAETRGRYSDVSEKLKLSVSWRPENGVMGVSLPGEIVQHAQALLQVNSASLDFEGLLLNVTRTHGDGILSHFHRQFSERVFSLGDSVMMKTSGDMSALHIALTAEETVSITVDPRTGRVTLKDTGDLAAAGRGPRFSAITERINEQPDIITDAVCRFRYATILDSTEQKALYLGFRCYRHRNLKQEELSRLGKGGFLFIQLSNFPNHYLVLVVTDLGYKFALIAMHQVDDATRSMSVMDDIGWLDVNRITTGSSSLRPWDSVEQGMGSLTPEADFLIRTFCKSYMPIAVQELHTSKWSSN